MKRREQHDDGRELDLHEMPGVWFAALERGRRAGDTGLVTAAVENLRRLGYTVSFDREATR